MAPKTLTELHDARLVGLTYLTGASIRLDFEKVDSTKASVSLTGVASFFCVGMLEGNIVASVEVIDANDVSEDDLAYFIKKEGRGQTVEALRQTIMRRQLCMLLLSPSYGAELGCVCAAVACS